MFKILISLWICLEQYLISVRNRIIYKFDVMSLSFEMKILDVCVSIIFVGKEKPSMYCICHLSECSLSLVGCIKSSSHLRNVLHTNT